MILIHRKIREIIKKNIDSYWKSFDYIESKITSELNNEKIFVNSVFCTGEITNLFVYLQVNNDSYVYNNRSDFKKAVLLQSVNINKCKYVSEDMIYFPNTDLQLEKIPKVILVNLCVLNNFSVPRFNLSISSISSYIRLRQKARVFLLDMQLRTTIDDIIDSINVINPNIIGISISFGQLEISKTLIDQIYLQSKVSPFIVVGNIIPSLNKHEYLKRFNNLIVSYCEGEQTFIDLIDYINGNKTIDNVQGISYLDSDGKYHINTRPQYVDMNDLPFPSLDTIEQLIEFKGALTIETSRGCNYSKCSFCPREHKGSVWRALSVDRMVSYFSIIFTLANRFNIQPFLYIADEEFIGQLPHEQEITRINEFCDQIINRKIHVLFDISARVDSIYRLNETREHNIEKLKMWFKLKNIGLNRLFLGVESGCDSQLIRFNKGTTALQNRIALQLITAIGINIRIGYISFDPLMCSFDEIIENHLYVEQQDVLFNCKDINDKDIPFIYDSIIYNTQYNKIYLQNKPLYTKISYPLTSLEVFFNTKYLCDVKKCEIEHNKKLIGSYDMNMTRYRINYLNSNIGLISEYCQRWIDHNFPVLYALKGIYKTATVNEKDYIYEIMENYKMIDHYLLNLLLSQIIDISNTSLYSSLVQFLLFVKLDMPVFYGNIEERIISTLNYWEVIEEKLVISIINDYLKIGVIKDTIDNALSDAVLFWYKNKSVWEKINQ